MLDPQADPIGRNRFLEAEDRGMQQDGAPRLLGEPFPPLPELLKSAEPDNPLKKAMATVDLLQALEDVDSDELPAPPPGGLDDILLAELGPDADPQIPQAAAAIDRQLLLSRIVKARDAILAEEKQAARTVATIASPEPAPPPPEAPLYRGPAYDSDIAPEPRGNGLREALTVRRLALAVSVTALCIAAGWTLRSGELPAIANAVSASLFAAENAQARVAADEAATQKAAEQPVLRPAAAVSALVIPVPAASATQALAERMAPAEPQSAGPVEEVRIKERLIETHAGGPRPDEAPVQAVPATVPPPEPDPAPQVASVEPAPADPAPEPKPELPPAPQAAEPEPQLVPRDPAAVETALIAASLGLADLDPAQRAALKEKLVAGECPSTALADLLGRAPVVATRDLVMNLENGC